jgi:hypothetical protein
MLDHRSIRFTLIPILLGSLSLMAGPVNVLTNGYNNSRTGANTSETTLTVSNVNSSSFGALFSLPVNGSVYAEPLYVAGVTIPGKGVHNVLYVCTMEDTIYAFDADSNTGANATPLWTLNLVQAPNTVPTWKQITGSANGNVTGTVGIMSTPVINLQKNVMFVVARTLEGTTFVYRLHEVNITTGALIKSVEITASVPGTGDASVSGLLTFSGKQQLQRPGLALTSTGLVIIAWSSQEDLNPYHGWVMAYREDTLAQAGVFCTTPDGGRGGVWQSGRAPVVDSTGNVYFLVGNSEATPTDPNFGTDFGQSALKFSTTGKQLELTDWFEPATGPSLDENDTDIGSSGLLMIPNSDLVVGGGKNGVLYLLDSNNLGHEEAGNVQIPQALTVSNGRKILGGPVFWTSRKLGPILYTWDVNSYLEAFHFNGSTFDKTPVMTGTINASFGSPGAILTLSANIENVNSGIVWASMPISQSADSAVVPGVLRAINAENLEELWNSQQVPARDSLGMFAKFTPPLVVNGKVYMATFSDAVMVYGLLPAQASASVQNSVAAH